MIVKFFKDKILAPLITGAVIATISGIWSLVLVVSQHGTNQELTKVFMDSSVKVHGDISSEVKATKISQGEFKVRMAIAEMQIKALFEELRRESKPNE